MKYAHIFTIYSFCCNLHEHHVLHRKQDNADIGENNEKAAKNDMADAKTTSSSSYL